MRIAVLIYGRLDECAKSYDNIVNSIGNEHTIDFFMSSDNSNQELLESFINLYKPILYTNNKIHYTCGDLGRYPGKRDETNIHNMTCHFINKQRVYMLLENFVEKTSTKYDTVLSIRVDLIFHEKFVFGNEENTIYIPSGYDFVDNGINDQVAYGNMSVMEKYMSIFKNVIHLLNTRKSIPHPESLTLANIIFNNLKICRFNLSYNLLRFEHLPRGSSIFKI